jgi:hypothetical protein
MERGAPHKGARNVERVYLVNAAWRPPRSMPHIRRGGSGKASDHLESGQTFGAQGEPRSKSFHCSARHPYFAVNALPLLPIELI